MSVSLRPVYRAGKAPARPPIWLAFAALIAAIALTGVDIAHQFSVAQCEATAPAARVALPAVAHPAAPSPASRASMAQLHSAPAPVAPPVTPAS